MRSITENAILTKVRTLGVSGIEVAPNISPDGLSGCKQYIAPSADPRTMLFVTNGGAFGRGIPKTGIALNGEYLFYRNLKQTPVAVRLRDITSVEYHPSKQHKDSTYHSNDRIILHCGNKADRHMEDCLIGCDCAAMSSLLQEIVSIADQMSIQLQNRYLSEMTEEVRLTYLKILCNYCYQAQNNISPEALASIQIVANRLNLSSDYKIAVTEYVTDMDHRETSGRLISQIAHDLAAGDLNTFRMTLLFDVIYFCAVLHDNMDDWKTDTFLLGLAKTLRVSQEQLGWLAQMWHYYSHACCQTEQELKKQKKELTQLADMYLIPTHEFEFAIFKAQSVVLCCQMHLKQHLYWRYFNLLKENEKLLPDVECNILEEICAHTMQADLRLMESELVEELDETIISECVALCGQTHNNEHYHLLAYLYAQSGDRIRMEEIIDYLKANFVVEFDIKQEIDNLYKIACCQMNRKMYRLYQLFLENPKKALKTENGIKDCLGFDLLDYWLFMPEKGNGWKLIKSGKYIRDGESCNFLPLTYGCFAVIHNDNELGKQLFLHTTSKGRTLLKEEKTQQRKETVSSILNYIIDDTMKTATSIANTSQNDDFLQKYARFSDAASRVKEYISSEGDAANQTKEISAEIKHECCAYLNHCTESLQNIHSDDEYASFLSQLYTSKRKITELWHLTPSNCVLRKCEGHIFVMPQ